MFCRNLQEPVHGLSLAPQVCQPRLSALVPAAIPTNVVYINQGGDKGKIMGSQVGRVAIAEFGSLQVEFLALSQRTANTTYGETAEKLYHLLYQNYPEKVKPSHGFGATLPALPAVYPCSPTS